MCHQNLYVCVIRTPIYSGQETFSPSDKAVENIYACLRLKYCFICRVIDDGGWAYRIFSWSRDPSSAGSSAWIILWSGGRWMKRKHKFSLFVQLKLLTRVLCWHTVGLMAPEDPGRSRVPSIFPWCNRTVSYHLVVSHGHMHYTVWAAWYTVKWLKTDLRRINITWQQTVHDALHVLATGYLVSNEL